MKQSQKHSRAFSYVIAVLVFLLGALLFAYPFVNRRQTALNAEQTLESFRFVRSVYNDAADAPIINDDGVVELTPYQKSGRSLTFAERNNYDKTKFNELKAAMEDYNQKIYGDHQAGLKDAWSYEEAEFDLTRYGLYENVIAELRVPAMDCDLPLYLGATWDNMAWGAVQLGKTSMPIGGATTNCVIAGHRGCKNGPYFLYIQNLTIGDKVYIDNLWETLTYKVTDIRIISPDDIPSILIQEGKDMVTLITCHPYPYNYQRYAVFCERCENDPPVEYDENGIAVTAIKSGSDGSQQDGSDVQQVIQTSVAAVDGADESKKFIQAETILTYAIPAFLVLLAVVLFALTSKRRLIKRRRKKETE